MIRKLLLMMSVVAVAGLGPAVAQDIFIKKNKDQDDGAKPSIFLKPKILPKTYKKAKKYKDFNKDHLKNEKLKQISLENMQTLEDWQKSGIKPQTAEEVAAYAGAHRAVHQNLMYQRREALIKHLAKKERKRQQRIASRELNAYKKQQAEDKAKAQLKSKKKNAVEVSAAETQEKPKKKNFFSKSKSTGNNKPKKIFNNYR